MLEELNVSAETTSQLLAGLNPPQRQAVQQIEGPVLVLAGAGTGKTRVITARIAYMIAMGIPPEHIAAMTFTNKAASEMRDRVAQLVSADAAQKVTLGTFHAFCARILRRDISHVGHYDSRFTIVDEADQTGIIKQACAELGYGKDELAPKDALAFISSCKNKMIYPENANGADIISYNRTMQTKYTDVYSKYQQLLELQNAVDFDDLLLLVLKLFKENPKILKYYRDKYSYLLVDEYQDTNAAQFQLIQYLTGLSRNICVVGDDDQSIYAWRGADVGNILNFPIYFPGTVQIKLEQNYRSTNRILIAANSVIAHNGKRFDKNLWSDKGDGEEIQLAAMTESEDEARFVLDMMRRLMREHPTYCFADFAVLYRSNYLSRVLEQTFRANGIHPTIIGGQEFFQRKEVKDAVAYLKLVSNPRDDQSLLRIISVPPRGVGSKAILALRDVAHTSKKSLQDTLIDPAFQASVTKAAAKACSALYDTIVAARSVFRDGGKLAKKVTDYLLSVGYLNGFQRMYRDSKEADERRDNVYEFVNSIASFERSVVQREGEEPTLDYWLEKFSLLDDNDRTKKEEKPEDSPVFSTVHAAKGLEFPVVFVVGMEKDIFPNYRALEEDSVRGEEEERRLFYVAITRAKERLFLTMSRKRMKYGDYELHSPSPFLKDLPGDLGKQIKSAEDFFPEADADSKRKAFEDILKSLQRKKFF